jgi:hypothetical protein
MTKQSENMKWQTKNGAKKPILTMNKPKTYKKATKTKSIKVCRLLL